MRQCLFTNQRHPELIQDLLSCLLREGVRVLCMLRGLFPTWAVQTWQWILGGVEDVLLEAGLDRLPVNTPIEGTHQAETGSLRRHKLFDRSGGAAFPQPIQTRDIGHA